MRCVQNLLPHQESKVIASFKGNANRYINLVETIPVKTPSKCSAALNFSTFALYVATIHRLCRAKILRATFLGTCTCQGSSRHLIDTFFSCVSRLAEGPKLVSFWRWPFTQNPLISPEVAVPGYPMSGLDQESKTQLYNNIFPLNNNRFH